MKKAKKNELEFFKLNCYGCVTGFDFTQGGDAVVHLAFPEVHRFLDILVDIEKEAPKPSEEIMAALTTASKLLQKRHYGRTRSPEYNIEATVPISQGPVKIQHACRNVSISEPENHDKDSKRSILSGDAISF